MLKSNAKQSVIALQTNVYETSVNFCNLNDCDRENIRPHCFIKAKGIFLNNHVVLVTN